MTIFKYEPFSDNLSIGELAKYDCKANMLETFRLIGVGVAKSWDKASLASGLDIVFEQSPALFANLIPKEEGMLLAGLLDRKQDEYVTCPANNSKFLMLQKLHMVVTFEDKKQGTWRLYMPENIRKRLNSMLEEERRLYPEIEKAHNLLAQIASPIKSVQGIRELTLKVQLDDTPIFRTFKVIDRCSFFELNMLIQFCYDWHNMNPYGFVFYRDGQKISPLKTTRLLAFALQEGDTFLFKYDVFGDKWIHTLTVQKVESYTGKEEEYEPLCIAGNGPDPGEGAGGNAWVRRNLPYILKNKKKYYPFSKAAVNDSFHFWWSMERLWWIEDGIIKYDE